MNSRRNIKGFTLVELMVGLVISMLIILGMLALYKTAIRFAIPAQLGANAEGQMSAGIIAADKLVQRSGNKRGSPTSTSSFYLNDLLLVSSASMSGTTLSGSALTTVPTTTGSTGNAILWVENTNGTFTLNGLFAPASGGLKYITGSGGASAPLLSALWSSTSWSSQDIFKAPSPAIPDSPNAGVTTFTITSTGASKCQPFSGTNASFVVSGGKYTLTTNVVGYAGNQKTISSTTCLINFS